MTSQRYTPEFVSKVAQATREAVGACLEDPATAHRLELSTINEQISKIMDLVLKLIYPDPALKKINELETRRLCIAASTTGLQWMTG